LDEQSRDHEGYALSERLRDRRPSPEEELRRAEHVAHLMHLVQQLPPTLRKAFELRDLDGLSIREMTDILRLPEGTVKARISRARAKLRSLMEAANRKYSFSHRCSRSACWELTVQEKQAVSMATKTVADLLVEILAAAEARRVYGASSDSLNGITDSIRKQQQI
jgi:hypothetical protein